MSIVNYVLTALKIKGGTDDTIIGNVGDRIKSDVESDTFKAKQNDIARVLNDIHEQLIKVNEKLDAILD